MAPDKNTSHRSTHFTPYQTMKTYAEKLRDPRWQRKRLEIMQRDEFTCTQCGDASTTLNVHHWEYMKDPWDVPNGDLITVCERCHSQIEECKKLSKGLMRQSDFRDLLKNIQRLLNSHGECRIESSNDRVSMVANVRKYRFLEPDECVRKGDEYWCGEPDGWVIYDRDRNDPMLAVEFGESVRRIEGYEPPPLKNVISGSSAFDSMISDAPKSVERKWTNIAELIAIKKGKLSSLDRMVSTTPEPPLWENQ
jgi:hypothetical protein